MLSEISFIFPDRMRMGLPMHLKLTGRDSEVFFSSFSWELSKHLGCSLIRVGKRSGGIMRVLSCL